MATNITASEVRYIGNFSSTMFPDLMIESAGYIPAGDAWLNQILSDNSELVFASIADTNKKALAKAAEIWFVAGLVAQSPPKDEITAGPVQVKANARRLEFAQECLVKAKELLGLAGYEVNPTMWSYMGGSDYKESGEDSTNVDYGQAQDDVNYPVNLFGIEN